MSDDDANPVDDMPAADRLANEIRRRRKAADLSQPKLAAMIGYSPQYVSLAERPGKGLPSASLISLIDRALDVGGVLLDLRGHAEAEQLALRHGGTTGHTDSDQPSRRHDAVAMGPSGDDVLRRDFLSSSLIAGLRTIVSAPVSDRRPDSGLVVRLRQRNARLRRLDDIVGGADTYSLYKAELESTVCLFKDNTHSPATSQELLSVIAEQAQQAGWAAFDAGWNEEALRLYKLALTAAQDAEDSALVGNSWAYMAYQEVTLGKSGVEKAANSCSVAGPDEPATVQALLLERLAWAHAKINQPREAERALARAGDVLNGPSRRQSPHWVSWVDAREIQIMTGRCWTELHRPMRAVIALEEALSDFDDTHARDKALYLSWLAEAYLDAGEAEQSATVVGRALDLSVGVGSVRPRQRIDSFAERLVPFRRESPVDEILERLEK